MLKGLRMRETTGQNLSPDEPGSRTCWQKFRRATRLTKEGATPINKEVFFYCFIALFESCYSITYIFPFLPEQILYFGYKEEEKGYYSGLIASSLFAGRIFGSYFWGWLADTKGRKCVIIVCMFLINLTNLAYGFAPSVPWAMAIRFANGLFNGLVGSVKTVLYDVCDDTNQSVGMSVISLGWGFGIVLGPLISGYLASPARHYPNVFSESGVFGRFPYLLPSLFAFIKMALFTVVLFKLPETLSKRPKQEMIVEVNVEESAQNDQTPLRVRFKPVTRSESSTTQPLNDVEPYPVSGVDKEVEILFMDSAVRDEYSSIYGLGALAHSMDDLLSIPPKPSQPGSPVAPNGALNGGVTQNGLLPKEGTATPGKPGTMTWRQQISQWSIVRLLRDYEVRMVICLYSVLSFCAIGYDEIFTVWASTIPSLGGLGFDTEEIGSVIGYSSITLLAINVFLFPMVESKIGIKKTFFIFGWFLVFISPLKPTFRFLLGSKIALWITLVSAIGLHRIATTTAFSCASLMVNNSVYPEDAGSVNGLSMTVAAMFRTLAPIIGGMLFSWSIVDGVKIGWPFDVNAVFLLFGVHYLVSMIISAVMPETLNKQKKRK